MKIYLEYIPIDDLPTRIKRPGEWFTRLIAVQVSNDGNCTPLYIPLVRFQRRAGQILIEINSDRPLVYITLQARRPFFNVFRFPWGSEEPE
jgi:hypothetical protein